jgi:hypothetical protein
MTALAQMLREIATGLREQAQGLPMPACYAAQCADFEIANAFERLADGIDEAGGEE